MNTQKGRQVLKLLSAVWLGHLSLSRWAVVGGKKREKEACCYVLKFKKKKIWERKLFSKALILKDNAIKINMFSTNWAYKGFIANKK